MQNRENIINTLRNSFINNDNVYAFWLEGSDAIGTTDKYSDLDLWIDVEDDYEDKIIEKIKKVLSNISLIDFFHEKEHGHSKIRQMFIHLKGTSEFLIIDLCVQSHSREIKFTIENKDEKVKVIFDKNNVIQYRHLNKDEFKNNVHKRINEIKSLSRYYILLVEKEVKRNNYLEAFNYYHNYILSSLLELYRIKYEPTKKNYNLKHITRDLPIDVVEKLEYLYKISSIEEVEKKAIKSIELINGLLEAEK
ncbi:hypothetical protein GOQ29_08920 [Clostridium sp. D2Q-14]|uniref:hypothetical protein n=1 Tax=Anaeromonas gelatinilytica TaxID=2683194 RepID=UPI00193BC59B|nr:hypothetical protein [Anaeromonas gelatinilytica]MBS4535735.1 hypothetical protein [Anaeromonas gelatinilytica]